MLTRVVPLVLAALAGIAAWLSLGVLAIVDGATRARVGVLPPWGVLVALVGVFSGTVTARRWSAGRALPLALTLFTALPWLPGRIPSAFLLWNGPLGWALWALTAIGLALPGLRALDGMAWLARPAVARWVAAVAGTGLFGLGALVLQPRIPTADEPHYLVITQSLLHDGDLRIEDNHARGEYLAYSSDELRPHFIERGRDGQIYPIHAPGLPVLLLPAFAVGGYPAAVMAMVALTALGLALVWTTTWQLTGSVAGAWLAWATLALTAPGFFHSFTIFPDAVGGVCVAVGVWALARLESGRMLSVRALLAAGAALALLPWLHTRFAILAGALGLVLLARIAVGPDRWRVSLTFLAIPIVSAVLWFGYFWVIWGVPNPAAPYGAATQTSLTFLGPGLIGLLFDQQFGLVANAPVYALAVVGLGLLASHRPRLALELLAIAVPYALAVASYQMWWGGHSAPARFLVAALPLAAIPIGVGWSRIGPGGRALTLVLLAASIGMVVVRVSVERGALLYNERDGFDLLLDWANRSVNLPLAFPSVHRSDPWSALSDAAVWTVAGALCGTAVTWGPRRSEVAWTVASAGLVLMVMVASSMVWSSYPDSVTPNTSALDLLHRWPSRWRALGWQSRPWSIGPVGQVVSSLDLSTTTRGPSAPGDAPPLFSIPRLPAGDYELALQGTAPPSGRLTMSIGRTSQAIETIDLEGHVPGLTGLQLRLPVDAHSVTILGDDTARRSIGRVTLRPRALRDSLARVDGEALRATRYGRTRAFFLDDNAFMEAAGFWTRGMAATDVVIDTLGLAPVAQVMPPVLGLRAGAVAATAMILSGRWRDQVALAPGESRDVTLPSSETGIWRVRLQVDSGFRPKDQDAGSTDRRSLGVWVELR